MEKSKKGKKGPKIQIWPKPKWQQCAAVQVSHLEHRARIAPLHQSKLQNPQECLTSSVSPKSNVESNRQTAEALAVPLQYLDRSHIFQHAKVFACFIRTFDDSDVPECEQHVFCFS